MARHQPLHVLERRQAADEILLVRHQRLDGLATDDYQAALNGTGVLVRTAQCLSRLGQTDGLEEFIDLPMDPKDLEDAIDDALGDHPDNGDVMAAVVLEAGPKKIVAVRQNAERFEIVGEGLRAAQSGLSEKAPPKIKIRGKGALEPFGLWVEQLVAESTGCTKAMLSTRNIATGSCACCASCSLLTIAPITAKSAA